MGLDLYRGVPAVRRELDRLAPASPFDLRRIMFEGDRSLLFPPPDTPHPSVFIEVTLYLSLAVARALRAGGAAADMAAGRSMGEFSACAFAGVFSAEDCLGTAREMLLRGQPHNLRFPTRLATVYGVPRRPLQAAAAALRSAGDFCELITYFSRPSIGFVGVSPGAVGRLKRALAGRRHRLTVSPEPNAFHTSAYDAYAAELRPYFDSRPFADPAFPVYANCDARPHLDGAGLRRALLRGANHRVKWCESVEAMAAAGASLFVEMAPGAMLTEFICRLPPGAEVLRTDTPDNFRRTLRRLREGA